MNKFIKSNMTLTLVLFILGGSAGGSGGTGLVPLEATRLTLSSDPLWQQTGDV